MEQFISKYHLPILPAEGFLRGQVCVPEKLHTRAHGLLVKLFGVAAVGAYVFAEHPHLGSRLA